MLETEDVAGVLGDGFPVVGSADHDYGASGDVRSLVHRLGLERVADCPRRADVVSCVSPADSAWPALDAPYGTVRVRVMYDCDVVALVRLVLERGTFADELAAESV